MKPRQFTEAQQIHLLDLMESYDYITTEREFVRYILLHQNEPAIVDLAHYFIDFPEGEENA